MKDLIIEKQTIEELKKELVRGYPYAEGAYVEYKDVIDVNNTPLSWISENIDNYKNYNMFLYSNRLMVLYTLYRAIYSVFILDDEEKALEEFTRANEYTYLSVHVTSLLCFVNCDINIDEYEDDEYALEPKPHIEMDELSTLWGLSFLMNDFKKADTIAKDLIDSLNTKGCIIRRGHKSAYVEWFMVKLYVLVMEIELDKRKPMYPKKDSKFSFYEKILLDWDTTDMSKFQLMIETLCTLRLELTEPMLDKDDKFRKPFLQLLPFEVIMLLRLREKRGIENPTEFIHPLMNTPLMTMILNSSKITKKNTYLPFAKKLLENLEESYSELVLPDDIQEVYYMNNNKKYIENGAEEDAEW